MSIKKVNIFSPTVVDPDTIYLHAKQVITGENVHINEFKDFFVKAGVKFTEWKVADEDDEINVNDSLVFFPDGTHTVITVTQAHFLFTKVGNYIGVIADENGSFELKIET